MFLNYRKSLFIYLFNFRKSTSFYVKVFKWTGLNILRQLFSWVLYIKEHLSLKMGRIIFCLHHPRTKEMKDFFVQKSESTFFICAPYHFCAKNYYLYVNIYFEIANESNVIFRIHTMFDWLQNGLQKLVAKVLLSLISPKNNALNVMFTCNISG